MKLQSVSRTHSYTCPSIKCPSIKNHEVLSHTKKLLTLKVVPFLRHNKRNEIYLNNLTMSFFICVSFRTNDLYHVKIGTLELLIIIMTVNYQNSCGSSANRCRRMNPFYQVCLCGLNFLDKYSFFLLSIINRI